MIAIIIFWTLILVSLKLLALIIADSFRPLPKPTAKRKPRKSSFLDPLSVTMMAMAKGRGVEDLRREQWGWVPDPSSVQEALTLKDCNFAKKLHKRREHFAGCRIEEPYFLMSRAKVALAKMLDMPLKQCLLQTHPHLLDWAGMEAGMAIASDASSEFAYFSGKADHYLWLVPLNRDFTSWQVRGAMSDRDFSSLFERGLIRVTSSGYAQVPKKLFNNPRAWYDQVLSSGVNK